jgi:cytochrome c oxidase subunit 3
MGAEPRPIPSRPAPVRKAPVIPNAVVAMTIFIIAEAMVFAGMISAFNIVQSGAEGAWPPLWQPRLPIETTAANTLVLLLSGAALALSNRMQDRRGLLMKAALVMGAYFVLAQGYEWVRLISAGLTMTTSQHGAFFYLIVGCHALHAIGAIAGLGWVTRRQTRGIMTGGQYAAAQMFWFFVVGIWPALYVLVYL